MKRNKIALASLCMAAALLLAACGGSGSSSATSSGASAGPASQPASQAASQPASQAASQPKGEDVGLYECKTKGAKFKINLVLTGGRSSGEGQLENLQEMPGAALGVAACNKYSEGSYGTKLDECTTADAVPAQIVNNLVDLFDETNAGTSELKGFDDQTVTITSVETVGEVNGYELCKFTAVYTGDSRVDGIKEFPIVGYCTLLNQSGYPLYVAAIDVSEGAAYADQLDSLAYNCIITLRETA